MNTTLRLLLFLSLITFMVACDKDDEQPLNSTCTISYSEAGNPIFKTKTSIQYFDSAGYFYESHQLNSHFENDLVNTCKYDSDYNLTEFASPDQTVYFFYSNGLKTKMKVEQDPPMFSESFIFEYENDQIVNATYHEEGSFNASSMSFYYKNGLLDSCKKVTDYLYTDDNGNEQIDRSIDIQSFEYDANKNLTNHLTRYNLSGNSGKQDASFHNNIFQYNGKNQLVNYTYVNRFGKTSFVYTYNDYGNISKVDEYSNDVLIRIYTYAYSGCGSKQLKGMVYKPWLIY